MAGTNEKSFTEVNDIIKHMDLELQEKIPNGFKKIILENMDESYIPKIDYSISINSQDLIRETRVILSLIYRDYLCSELERKKIIIEDDKELKMQEELLRKKYEIDFEKRNKQLCSKKIDYISNEELPVVITTSKVKIFFNELRKIFLKVFSK